MPGRWQQNHGNLLLGVAGVILILGSAVIGYRQMLSKPTRYAASFTRDGTEAIAGPALFSEADEDQQLITVRVIGAASDEGTMKVAFYTQAEGFNDTARAVGADSWKIQNGVSEGRIAVPAESNELAIAAYHDANDNGVLDRNALGIPTERYGYSGDARGLTGPPEYSEAVVPITDEPIVISIR